MSLKWYQDADKSTSMMRVGAMVAIVVGGFMILAGIALAVAMLVLERYELVSFVTVLATTGPGVIALSLGAKAWQAQKEA